MKTLVVLSGGQDSTTCLALAISQWGPENVHAITFDYGQRHRAEINSAKLIALKAGIQDRHEVVVVQGILKGTSPLVSTGSEVEQYAGVEALPGGLEKTFVPMRNTLFLTIAANRAVLLAKDDQEVRVMTGVSEEDYGGYPDCRASYIEMMEEAINASLDDTVLPSIILDTPLIHLSKRLTVEMSEGLERGREFVAYSHTCYNGAVPPCGKCHACLLRQKGYDAAGVTDPLIERLVKEGRYATAQ